MGHAQLLMAVLVTILIGVGIAVGITQFNESAQSANRDAIAADCQKIIALAQQWVKKPESLGGGGGTFSSTTNGDVSLGKLGIAPSNDNGTYTLTVSSGTGIVVEATGTEKNNATPPVSLQVGIAYDLSDDGFTYVDNLDGTTYAAPTP
jgi:hypothetical protein